MEAFRDFVHDCSLMYMGIQRDSLTWWNRRMG